MRTGLYLIKLRRFLSPFVTAIMRLPSAAHLLLEVLFFIVSAALGLVHGLRHPGETRRSVRMRNVMLVLCSLLLGFGIFGFGSYLGRILIFSSLPYTEPLLICAGIALTAVTVLALLLRGQVAAAVQQLCSAVGDVMTGAFCCALREPFNSPVLCGAFLFMHCLLLCAFNSAAGKYHGQEEDRVDPLDQ